MAKIQNFLADEEAMAVVREMAETGASIATIEATLSLRNGTLKRWLQRGKDNPKTVYSRLYTKYRSWAAQARYAAESAMIRKSPERWMERNSSAQVVEQFDSTPLLGDSTRPDTVLRLGAQQALDTLRVLREAGHSIDDLIDRGEVHIGSNEPMQKDISQNDAQKKIDHKD